VKVNETVSDEVREDQWGLTRMRNMGSA